MKISVIIPCRNEYLYIEECIEAIYKNILPEVYEITIYVVDGMSNDGTREIVLKLMQNYSNLHLIDNHKKLTPFAFNLGIHQEFADYIQIIGARHIISSDYILKGIQILENDTSIWCVGGRLINNYTNSTSEMISNAMDTSFGMGIGNFRILVESGFTDTVTSPLYPFWVFNKIGYFDEQLVRNQDDDFNFRVTNAGGKIWFEHSISLKYYVRAAYNKLYRQFYQYGYWKVFVNKKHNTVTTMRQLVPPIFVLYLFIILPIFFLINMNLGLLASAGLLVYKALAIYFSIKKANSLKKILGIILTFPILHISYGLGYLVGILHFVILGRSPSEKQIRLSR
jgi:glycosyltransferase involved in cell wall biosynthesis